MNCLFLIEINDLIIKCLTIDENKRISLENILSHKWLNTAATVDERQSNRPIEAEKKNNNIDAFKKLKHKIRHLYCNLKKITMLFLIIFTLN